MSTGVLPQARPLAGPTADGILFAEGAYRILDPGTGQGYVPSEDLAGILYQGFSTTDAKAVLIKRLAPELASEDGARERLLAEIPLVVQMTHKNLVATLGVYPFPGHFGQVADGAPLASLEKGDLLLCTEVVGGQTLRQVMDKKRQGQGQPLSIKGAYNALANVCNLLTYAHGVLPHGALCPELVEIQLTGQVRVSDLAISRFVSPDRLRRVFPRSAIYLAPERLRGAAPSVFADIYALGMMLLESLSAVETWTQESALAARLSQLNKEVPAALDEIVQKALAKEPENRYRSPQELKEAIADALAERPKGTSSRSLLAYPSLDKDGKAAHSTPKVSTQMPALIVPPAAPAKGALAPEHEKPSLRNAPASSADGVVAQATNMAQTPGNGAPPTPPGLPGTPLSPSGQRPQVQGGPSGVRAVVPQGVDEDAERWLITKEDKMDYGPFPLREVRSQIEKGSVTADHLILDTETGDRRRIREHPLLSDMAKEWEGKHAQAALELRDHSEKAKHRASVQKLLSGIFIVLLVIGVGVGGYFKFFYKPEVKTVVVKEQSADEFFAGVQIAMKVDPPPPKKKGPVKKRVMKNGKWEEVTSMDAGEDGGDETLSGEQVQSVMNKNFRVLGGCLKEEAARNPSVKKLDLDFQIRGSGVVAAVKVNGEATSTVANCVFAKMQSVQFPKFNGTKTHAAFSLSLK